MRFPQVRIGFDERVSMKEALRAVLAVLEDKAEWDGDEAWVVRAGDVPGLTEDMAVVRDVNGFYVMRLRDTEW